MNIQAIVVKTLTRNLPNQNLDPTFKSMTESRWCFLNFMKAAQLIL